MRQLEGTRRKIFGALAFGGSIYFLLSAFYLQVHPMQHGPIVVGWGVVLCFALYPMRKKDVRQKPSPLDLLCMALTIAISIYTVLSATRYIYHPQEASLPDVVVASLWLVLSALAMWRSFGSVIPILMIFMLCYTRFGPYFPGVWGHRGFDFWRIMEQLQTTAIGFWGIMLWILITVVPLFMILANLLFAGVGAQALVDVGKLVAGRMRGGAAQIAVVASGIMGMISGSAIANVATTGSFTIPLMKRLGYKPEFSGAVECVASSGGLVAPPIMGAGAFIMAEILEVPYLRIIAAAVIPAIIYFTTVAWGVYLEAGKTGLARIPPEEIPHYREVLQVRKLAPLVIPIAVLLFLMIYVRMTVMTSGFWAVISCIGSYVLAGRGVKEWWSRILMMGRALEQAGFAIASLVALGVVVQVVVALVGLTGVAVAFTSLMLPAAKISILLALGLTALATLILGMGLPVTAAYIVAVSVLAQGLAIFELNLLAIHMFIFYFSMLAAITPPVCAAVYVATPIAGSKLWPTASRSLTLASSAYVVAFLLAVDTRLLMEGTAPAIIARTVITLTGALCFCVVLRGYLFSRATFLQRILFLAAAAAFLLWDFLEIPISMVAIGGISAGAMGVMLNHLSFKRHRAVRGSFANAGADQK